MTEIFIYALAIMYSPGPVNFLGLHSGLSGLFKHSFGYFFGVGSAMLLLFLCFGYLGEEYVQPSFLPYFAALGCSYILYIAYKVGCSTVEIGNKSQLSKLTYWDGLGLQLLNPKGVVATLPISTVQFPSANIDGWNILFWSVVLALLATGAPTSYAALGSILGRKLQSSSILTTFNKLMALLLVYVAFSIGYEHIYLPINN
ncbi:transporter [Vibrio ponticus]|uniref:Transporter n=1 Tax=Vibrio ponticus TaxID=265668 RepID=A0ABX3F5U8_9VIBR|nr:transporter [Vibrio ponticus]OLQ85452.1 transporter [Vibrio ponticus]